MSHAEQDTDILGVWQDANTLRKRPIFGAAGDTKKTTCATLVDLSADDDDDDGDACDNDIQVIKVVESHASEISRSGNTSKYFGSFLHKLTSSCVLCSSSSPLSVTVFIRINFLCQFLFIIDIAWFLLLSVTCVEE